MEPDPRGTFEAGHGGGGLSIRSEELVEKPVIVQARPVDRTAIAREKWLDEGGSEIELDAPGGQRQILMPIGHAETAAIDEAGEAPMFGHQVGHAGVAVRDHKVFRGGT